MQLHAYIACFFLAAAFLYAISGGLYLFGFEGGLEADYDYYVELEDGWPEDKDTAREIVLQEMQRLGQDVSLPTDYYLWDGMHDWFGLRREVLLIPEDDGRIKLALHEHDFWKELLLVHKGFAGPFLKVFSILWGVSLIFSQVSGAVLALNMPSLKRNALISIVGGFMILVVAFVLG